MGEGGAGVCAEAGRREGSTIVMSGNGGCSG